MAIDVISVLSTFSYRLWHTQLDILFLVSFGQKRGKCHLLEDLDVNWDYITGDWLINHQDSHKLSKEQDRVTGLD